MSVTVPPPTPVPAPGYWPMPPPGALPGCGPPSGSLMDCYWSVQSATAFISAIMIDAINNNPAVAQAMIDAITKSGSALPLLGVTNGADAQPGQVGEWVMMTQSVSLTGASNETHVVSMGVLQPGDWNCWAFASFSPPVVSGSWLQLTPLPAGFATNLWLVDGPGGFGIASVQTRALISVPTLIPLEVQTNTGAAGTAGSAELFFFNRRQR